MLICMRWPTPHGWLLGKITGKFDKSTPRLLQKFNYRVKWFDGWGNHMIILENYNSGPTAAYKSWVCCCESRAVAEPAAVELDE